MLFSRFISLLILISLVNSNTNIVDEEDDISAPVDIEDEEEQHHTIESYHNEFWDTPLYPR